MKNLNPITEKKSLQFIIYKNKKKLNNISLLKWTSEMDFRNVAD